MESLWNQPWQLQVAIGAGYAAYTLAYIGIRDHHRLNDQLFKTLVFSVVASAVLHATKGWDPLLSGLLAIATTLIAGLLWRKVGLEGLAKVIRKTGTRSDDLPSAWAKIALANKHDISQLAVELIDGTRLYCSDLGKFRNAPHECCTFGGNGDIALYVTERANPGAKLEAVDHTIDDHYGWQLTYVPSVQIRFITVRYT